MDSAQQSRNGTQRWLNRVLHFIDEETEHIKESIFTNFIVSYVGDLTGRTEEVEDKISDVSEIQGLDLIDFILEIRFGVHSRVANFQEVKKKKTALWWVARVLIFCPSTARKDQLLLFHIVRGNHFLHTCAVSLWQAQASSSQACSLSHLPLPPTFSFASSLPPHPSPSFFFFSPFLPITFLF